MARLDVDVRPHHHLYVGRTRIGVCSLLESPFCYTKLAPPVYNSKKTMSNGMFASLEYIVT